MQCLSVVSGLLLRCLSLISILNFFLAAIKFSSQCDMHYYLKMRSDQTEQEGPFRSPNTLFFSLFFHCWADNRQFLWMGAPSHWAKLCRLPSVKPGESGETYVVCNRGRRTQRSSTLYSQQWNSFGHIASAGKFLGANNINVNVWNCVQSLKFNATLSWN